MIADDGMTRLVGGLERTRFFARQLVLPADLTQVGTYFLERQRRHNRYSHGWGIVQGGSVQPGKGSFEVVVEACYLLSPDGDEIVIAEDVTLDVRRAGLDGYAVQPCADDFDTWCSDVTLDRTGQTLYVAVRYAECHTRPVRVLTETCGAEGVPAEYSRTRDSYAIALLENLPSTYELAPADGPSWPPETVEPWVVLASVTVGTAGGPPTIGAVPRWHPANGTAPVPATAGPASLVGLTLARNPVRGGQSVLATIVLSAPAPADAVVGVSVETGGAVPTGAVTVPPGVDLTEGASTATFTIATSIATATLDVGIGAFYEGQTRSISLRVLPPNP